MMPIYRIDREITEVHGTQSYKCIAKSRAEAAKIFESGEGEEFIEEDVTVEGLADIDIDEIYEIKESEE